MSAAIDRLEPQRVLVLAPTGRDAALAADVLVADGLETRTCHDIAQLCEELAKGAGAAVVAEEALRPEAVALLLAALARQPPWSDFPFILLGESDGPLRRDLRLAEHANVTILERPFRMRTLLAAVRSALRARRRQYDAQRAIRDRDQFLAMLGHELRNPLSAILLALQLLRQPLQPDKLQSERQLAVLERQARRLSRLVDDLLDVSRITSGKVQLRMKPTDLREALERSAETVAAAAADAGLHLGVELPPQPVIVHADSVRLEQVFTNLLANAVKFTPAGGRVQLSASVSGSEAVVLVRDTGVGIDPANLQRIFELFAQLEPTMDRSRGGLGIGLTLAHSLVDLHGGAITAASEGIGRGTEFCVRLPLAASSLVARADEEARIQSPNARRVVIIEDNDDIRTMFRYLVERGGHEVHEASDGLTGVELILGRRPDVAFIDIGLPSIDGYEVARRVRGRLGATVRLVAVTGYGQPEDRARAREAGFDAHLTKPVDAAAVHRVLEAPVGAPQQAMLVPG